MIATDVSALRRAGQTDPVPHRAAVVVGALATTAAFVAHVAQRTTVAGSSFASRLVARLDVGTAVLLVLAGWWLHRGSVAAIRSDRPLMSWRDAVRRVVGVLVAYWAGLAVAMVVSRPAFGVRQFVGATATLPPFRATRIDGFGQGWVIGTVVLAAAFEPGLARIVRRGNSQGRDPVLVLAGLVAAGLVIRIGLVAGGHPLADSPVTRLPGNVDLLGIGAVLAWRRPSAAWRRPLGALAVVGYLLLSAAVHVAPRGLTASTPGEVVRHLLVLIVAGAIGAIAVAGRPPRSTGAGVLAAVVLAAFVWYQAAAELVLRQYVERRADSPIGVVVDGAWLPPMLWSGLLSIALSATALGAWSLARRGGRSMSPTVATASVVAGAFVLRVVALLTVAPPKPDGGDPLFYHTTANLLSQGRGFIEPLNWIAYGRAIPSALHGPGYPVYLSVFSRLGATTIFDHRMASILAGTGVVAVIAAIARRVAGDRAMVIAALVAALYPNLWIIDGVLFPEGLFILTTGLVVLAAYRWTRTRARRDALLLGVLIGASAMVRGEGLFLIALLVVPLVALTRDLTTRRKLVSIAFAALGVLVALAPWTIRNATTFNSFVSLSTNGDELHVYANCDDTYSGKYLGFWLFDCQERLRQAGGEAKGDESERARYWRDIGWQYARDHVGELPKVVAARLGRQWELFRPLQNVEFAPIEGRDKRVALAGLLSYYALVPFAIGGLVGLRRRRVRVAPLVAQFVSVSVTAAYAYGTVRFRAPAELSLCVLAAVGLVPLARRASRWWRPADGVQPLHDPRSFVLGGPLRTRVTGAAVRSTIALGGLATLLLAPLRGLLRTPGAPMEEGFMLTFPERVMKGDVPNVDFLHLYGPGSLDVLAGVYAVFGVRVEVERMFGFTQHVALAFGLYALLRTWGRAVASIGAGLAVTLIVTPIGLDALAWTGALALGVWSLVFALRATATDGRSSRRCAVVAGVLAGVTLTYRPDLVVALALAHGAVWWRSRPQVRRFAVGVVTGLVPMWVHLVRAGIGPSVRGMLLDPVFRLRGGRTLPRPPSWSHLDGALQVIAEKFPPWWPLPSLAAPHQLVLWFWLVPTLAVGLVGWAWWLRRSAPDSPGGRVLWVASLFSLGLVQQGFQRPDSAHFAWVTCVSLAVAAGAGAEIVGRVRPTWRSGRRAVAVGACLAAVYLTVMPFFSLRIYTLHVRQTLGQLPPGLVVQRGDRRFYLGDTPPWMASNELVADLDRLSHPGQRLLVGPIDLRQTVYSDAVFYYLFPELTPATKYIEMDPGVADAADSGLADEVASADWLILTRFWAGWIEPNDSIVFGPDAPNQVVEQQFCLVGSYQHDLARLYRKCAGGGAPGPYEGPYDPTHDPAVEVRVPVPRRPDGTCTPTCATPS